MTRLRWEGMAESACDGGLKDGVGAAGKAEEEAGARGWRLFRRGATIRTPELIEFVVAGVEQGQITMMESCSLWTVGERLKEGVRDSG